MRVLQMIGSLEAGGSQAMIISLYKTIDRSRIQFDFIIDNPDKTELAPVVEALGAKIYFLPKFNGINVYDVNKAWNLFFSEHPEYKILHSHVRSYASIYIPIAKKYGLKTIIHSHSTSNGKGIISIAKLLLQYPLRFQADYFFACSKEAGEWLFGRRCTKLNKFYVLRNAIDANEFKYNSSVQKEVRNEFSIQDEILLGHIGRFEYPKNHKFLLKILNMALKKGLNVKMMLIGDGSLHTEIENEARSLGIYEFIIFTGVREDVYRLIQGFDIFVFPSHFEGLGIVAIEAQAAGLPCLVSENVPKEVKVTDLISFLPVDDSSQTIDNWVEKIRDTKTEQRRDTKQEIIDAGYDINDTAKWLTDFYMGIL